MVRSNAGALLLSGLVLACAVGVARGEGSLGEVQRRGAVEALLGTWTGQVGDQQIELTLGRDGRFVRGDTGGGFRVEGGVLTLATPDGPVGYGYGLDGDRLTLSGGDLMGELTLTRRFDLVAYLAHGWDLTAEGVWVRAYRIGLIAVVVLGARVAIGILGVLSRATIFWTWGPFVLLYRHNKNRARTVHSLVLNVVKYFIYFTALGMVLSELGVNYATYLASLSVVGLAIGFGSQGLVQDMVTGFFIVFEGQFDVGDMVEISGQTGYVTDIGLRMTKIRNYLGQIVVIPNRNIAIVGNYHHGGQRGYVDIPVASRTEVDKASPVVKHLAERLLQQYKEVILGPIRTSHLSVGDGEHYCRLHLSIWPGQSWVVDQQVVPRVREALATHGIDLASDNIAVHYHPHQKPPVEGWHKRVGWFGRKDSKSEGSK